LFLTNESNGTFGAAPLRPLIHRVRSVYYLTAVILNGNYQETSWQKGTKIFKYQQKEKMKNKYFFAAIGFFVLFICITAKLIPVINHCIKTENISNDSILLSFALTFGVVSMSFFMLIIPHFVEFKNKWLYFFIVGIITLVSVVSCQLNHMILLNYSLRYCSLLLLSITSFCVFVSYIFLYMQNVGKFGPYVLVKKTVSHKEVE
jgi:hypothetical protein